MKIKTWLLLSYLVVMLLPLAAGYGLFAWINSYHQDQNVAEYLDSWLEVQKAETVLNDPSIYQQNADWSEIDGLATDQFSITLYTSSGFMLYSSNPLKQPRLSFIGKKELYEDFYKMQRKFGTYIYKEPIFTGNSLAGVYEVELPRDQWTSAVKNRTWLVIALFAVFFILLFTAVAVLVNRKLNRPLQMLMEQMASFAKGNSVQSMPKRNDEIGELAASFDSMQTELEAAKQKIASEQQQKEFMIASISHDLKTPLTSIRAYAEALQSETRSLEEQREYYDVIMAKSNYMKQMLDDLLMYTLLQSNTYDMEFVQVEGDEFFDMLVSGYQTLCDEKQVSLDVLVDVSGEYAVNAKQMMRVVDNLVANAIAHTEVEGSISLSAADAKVIPTWIYNFVQRSMTADDGMYLIVQNAGQGISEEHLTYVFDPLFQADAARTKAGERGNGLGLSITKQIIEKHGGTVEMVSYEGTGTAVICWLPQMKEDEEI